MDSNTMIGPEPRINFQRVQKKKNCAEKFKDDHEGVYTAREKCSRNRCHDVEEHCPCCPKMHRELKKRKSLANVKGITSRNYTKTSRSYKKPKRLVRKKKASNVKRRSPAKKNYKQRDRYYKSTLMASKGCQYENITKTLNLNILSNLNINPRNESKNSLEENASKNSVIQLYDNRNSKTNTCSSKVDVKSSGFLSTTPDSKNPSLSSYHSFPSMDEEPMV